MIEFKTVEDNRIWVTKNNQQWVHECTGLTREEIAALYKEAREKKEILTLVVKVTVYKDDKVQANHDSHERS